MEMSRVWGHRMPFEVLTAEQGARAIWPLLNFLRNSLSDEECLALDPLFDPLAQSAVARCGLGENAFQLINEAPEVRAIVFAQLKSFVTASVLEPTAVIAQLPINADQHAQQAAVFGWMIHGTLSSVEC